MRENKQWALIFLYDLSSLRAVWSCESHEAAEYCP